MALILVPRQHTQRTGDKFVGLGANGEAITPSLQSMGSSVETPRRVALLVTDLGLVQDFIDLYGLTVTAESSLDDNDQWTMVKAPPVPSLPPLEPLSFAQRKAGRTSAVNGKTDKLISAGFTVDGKVFSASDMAQLKWLGMYTSRADLSYPVTVPTQDDAQFVSLIDASDVVTYYNALLTRIQTVLAGGVTLKTQIAAAANRAALDLIVDSRT